MHFLAGAENFAFFPVNAELIQFTFHPARVGGFNGDAYGFLCSFGDA